MTNWTENSIIWRKSSRCSTNACVEVAEVGDEIWLRDSKNLAAAPLRFTRAEWAAFLEGAGAGDFSF
ncbi:DUF397 domain-containing protein [Actinoplanes sp. NPDC049548]|uniref:DUF397 domain-containing protein n=1 Tax=Actinoplanes sp. NPDC049548 TaxID=3155152 RepID=UPI00343DFFAF